MATSNMSTASLVCRLASKLKNLKVTEKGSLSGSPFCINTWRKEWVGWIFLV